MKSTRYVEPFSKEVEYWEKTLGYIMETVENALIVQRQWLYLEVSKVFQPFNPHPGWAPAPFAKLI